MKSFLKQNFILIAIIFTYFFMGLAGLFYAWGLPYAVGDETAILSAGLKMINDFSLRPAYPSFYYFPLNAYVYLPVIAVYLLVLALFMPLSQIKAFVILDFYKFLPAVRVYTLLLGMVAIILVYDIAQKLFNKKRISLFAAFLTAFSLLFVQVSHFARVWVLQVVLILAVFNFFVRLYKKGYICRKDYLILSFLLALSITAHGVGFIVYIPFLVLLAVIYKSKFIKETIFNINFWFLNIFLILSVFLTIFLNPYAFSNYFNYYSQIGSERLIQAGVNPDWRQGLYYFSSVMLQHDPVLFILGAIGLILIYLKCKKNFYLIFSFIFGYYLFAGILASGGHAEPRYVMPLVPFFSLLAGYSLDWIFLKFKNKKVGWIIIACLLSFIFFWAALLSYKTLQPTTRFMARDWIYQNIPSGSSIINLDQYLTLNIDKETAQMHKNSTPRFFLKKDEFLLALDDQDLPAPNYFILTPAHFSSEIPQDLLEKTYDYVIISGASIDEIYEKINHFEPFEKYDLVEVVHFPQVYLQPDIDLAGNMIFPYPKLLQVKNSGPFIFIYESRLRILIQK